MDANKQPELDPSETIHKAFDIATNTLQRLVDTDGEVKVGEVRRLHNSIDGIEESLRSLKRSLVRAQKIDDASQAEALASKLDALQKEFARTSKSVRTPQEIQADDEAIKRQRRNSAAEAKAERDANEEAAARAKGRRRSASLVEPQARKAWATDKRLNGPRYDGVKVKAQAVADALVALKNDPSDDALARVRGAFAAIDNSLGGFIKSGATRLAEDQKLGRVRADWQELCRQFEGALDRSDRK